MNNFYTEMLINKVNSLRLQLPVEWAVYDVSIAEEIAEQEISDAKWEEIYSLFSEESQGLFGALAVTFAECVRQVTDVEEEDEE